MAGEPLQFFNSVLGCCDDCVSFGPCFIAGDKFDGDLAGLTIEVGAFNTAGGLLEHTGAGLILFKNTVAVDQYAPTTIRADPKVVSGDPAVSRLVIAAVDKQNYLFGEFQRDGSCLLGRLGRKLKGADSFLTEYVTVFTPSATDRFEARVCWDPGQPLEGGGMGGDHCNFFVGTPALQWTAETEATGPCDDIGAEVSLGGFDEEVVGFGAQFPPALNVPEGAQITRIEGGFRARWVPLSGVQQVTCTDLRVVGPNGAGSNLSPNVLINPLNYGWIGGEDTGHTVTWEDLRAGAVTIVGTMRVEAGGVQAVSIDCVTLQFQWRTEREEGVLRLVAGVNTPSGSSSTGEYGRTVAAARVRWLGTLAGIEPVSGSWNWGEALYEYAKSAQRVQCPECADGCFIFGDEFKRDSGPGCHYEILSGSFDTVEADRILKVTSADGRIVARHIPTNKDNDQFFRVVCEVQQASDIVTIVFGYSDTSECLAFFYYNPGTEQWAIDVRKDGGSTDTTVQGDTVALTFPATVELAICLQDSILTAQVGPVDSDDYYVVHHQELKDVTGTRAGVEAPENTEFSRWRFYQTPLAGVDCPPCGVNMGAACEWCAGDVPDLFIGIMSGAKEAENPEGTDGCHVPLDLEKVNTAFLIEGNTETAGCCRWAHTCGDLPTPCTTADDLISTDPCEFPSEVAQVCGNLVALRIGPESNVLDFPLRVEALYDLRAFDADGNLLGATLIYFHSDGLVGPLECDTLDIELHPASVESTTFGIVCLCGGEFPPGHFNRWVDFREAKLRIVAPPVWQP